MIHPLISLTSLPYIPLQKILWYRYLHLFCLLTMSLCLQHALQCLQHMGLLLCFPYSCLVYTCKLMDSHFHPKSYNFSMYCLQDFDAYQISEYCFIFISIKSFLHCSSTINIVPCRTIRSYWR